jgi:hypothetical protein
MKAFFQNSIHNQKVFTSYAFSASENEVFFTIFTARQKKSYLEVSVKLPLD